MFNGENVFLDLTSKGGQGVSPFGVMFKGAIWGAGALF